MPAASSSQASDDPTRTATTTTTATTASASATLSSNAYITAGGMTAPTLIRNSDRDMDSLPSPVTTPTTTRPRSATARFFAFHRRHDRSSHRRQRSEGQDRPDARPASYISTSAGSAGASYHGPAGIATSQVCLEEGGAVTAARPGHAIEEQDERERDRETSKRPRRRTSSTFAGTAAAAPASTSATGSAAGAGELLISLPKLGYEKPNAMAGGAGLSRFQNIVRRGRTVTAGSCACSGAGSWLAQEHACCEDHGQAHAEPQRTVEKVIIDNLPYRPGGSSSGSGNGAGRNPTTMAEQQSSLSPLGRTLSRFSTIGLAQEKEREEKDEKSGYLSSGVKGGNSSSSSKGKGREETRSRWLAWPWSGRDRRGSTSSTFLSGSGADSEDGEGEGEDESDDEDDAMLTDEQRRTLDPGSSAADRDRRASAVSTTALSHKERWAAYLRKDALRRRLGSDVKKYVDMSFKSRRKERAYQRQDWAKTKKLAMWAAVFLLYSWIILLATVPRPWNVGDQYIYYLLLTLVTVPLPILIYFDAPLRWPLIWQVAALFSAWAYPLSQIFSMYFCGFYGPPALKHCGGKDYQALFYYSSAAPVFSLFCFRQKRLWEMVGATCFAVICMALVVPQRHSWARNAVNVLIYSFFVVVLQGLRERNDRAMFTLQRKLALQVKKTNEAKEKERLSHDSKRRFQNFIFHEVRVPLNVALLAFENLDAHGCFEKPGTEFEYNALRNSHVMMSKVLDDVLDLDRMEMGKFTSVVRPFAFHSVITDIATNLKMSTRAKELTLEVKLDDRIDETAKKITESLDGDKCGEGHALVMGDGVRLQQIISNLTSNAVKFTPKGGSVSISTSLVYPTSEMLSPASPADFKSLSYMHSYSYTSAGSSSTGHDLTNAITPDVIIVRIEVTDSGPGIQAEDLENNKLFSPYVQTEIGQTQGGKGTGLGLSLVRHIVGLSGGRLGVRTQPGVGSTFYVELQYGASRGSFANGYGSAGGATAAATTQNDPTAVRGPRLTLSTLKTAQQGLAVGGGLNRMAFRPRTAPTPTNTDLFSAAVSKRPPMALQDVFNSSSRGKAGAPLPVPAKPAGSVKTASPLSTPVIEKDLSPLCIAIVDDDPITRKVMARMLTRLGARVWEADNGKVGLQMLQGMLQEDIQGAALPEKFDLCFMDNQMPVMNGISCVQNLRASTSACRSQLVCAVTGNATLHDQQEFLDAGADFIMTKPTGEAALSNMLRIAQERRNEGMNTPSIHQVQKPNPMDAIQPA